MAESLIDTTAGNYRLVAKLGEGGMGEVYKGVHATIGSKVAIKVLHATGGPDPGSEERFLREAKAVNLIEHDGVVKVLDAGRLANGRPFLVMELLDGQSLSEQQRSGGVPMFEACLVMADVLDALDAAHRVGVIHRDLKPANIFRTKSGRTVVLDFGIAKLMSTEGPARLTMMGSAVGTPHYMAPEQITDSGVGPAADIYTAGVVLFELLCARLPFEGATVHIMNGHLEQRPPPPRALRPEIPLAISDVVLKAMQKDPARRFPSAGAMRDALRSAMTSGMSVDAPLPPQEPTDAATRVERPVVRDIPTVQVPDTPRISMPQPMQQPMQPVQPPVQHAPMSPPTQRRRWPMFVMVGLVGVGLGAVVVWKLASKSAPVATAQDAPVMASDAKVHDAVVLDAVVGGDAAGSTGHAPVDLRAAHAAAIARASTLAPMLHRQMTRCLAPGEVETTLPHEDDPKAAAARLAQARYTNAIHCKYMRAYDEVADKLVRRANQMIEEGDFTVAAKLFEQQLAKVDIAVIDWTFLDRRARKVRGYLRDSRVPEIGKGRIKELLDAAQAEIAANQFGSANVLLDEAALTAWPSIALKDGQP